MPARVDGVSAPARTAAVDFAGVRQRVDAVLDRFLAEQARHAVDECLPPLVDLVREFVRGGKRLRPLFCYCGWLAADGDTGGGPIAEVGAALELFHTFALIHDDVIDGSAIRRGRPAAQHALARRYHGEDARAAARFGTSAAILLGDLCHAWSDELLCAAGEDGRRRMAPVLHEMRTELMAGQYLDLAGEPADDTLDRSWRTVRYKTAGYTVRRPLQVGAALAGGGRQVLAFCADFGGPLGEAFQLRDDLLGVFGDPGVTGKPALDDLREGKQTVLMVLAWRRAGEADRAVLRKLHGDPDLTEDGAERVREVIRRTGADTCVAELIGEKTARSFAVLDEARIPDAARAACAELVHAATHRTR